MKIYTFETGVSIRDDIPEPIPEAGLFVICRAEEAQGLSERFGWDKNTAAECVSLDETVRYSAYGEYDLINLIHMENAGDAISQSEINLFAGKHYLVLALPEQPGSRLREFADALCHFAENAGDKPDRLGRLYYLVLNGLAADYSNALETLEEELEVLSEAVTEDPDKKHLGEIGLLRKKAYAVRKILRATAHIGDEILLNENELLHRRQLSYFRSVNARLKNLYDFAASLYELSGEILSIYDSNLGVKMNESIGKLTAIMLFLALVTMITGIFNLDFRFLPAIDSIIGYPLALGVMAAISFILYRTLRKKKWL
jgi:magnesium transporter